MPVAAQPILARLIVDRMMLQVTSDRRPLDRKSIGVTADRSAGACIGNIVGAFDDGRELFPFFHIFPIADLRTAPIYAGELVVVATMDGVQLFLVEVISRFFLIGVF